MARPLSLTLNEAGYVVGRSRTAINRDIDSGVIRAAVRPRGTGRLRFVGRAELRFLALAREVEHDLTPRARRKVYEAIRRLPAEGGRLSIGVMEIPLAGIDRRISERLARLEEVKSFVQERPDGPILRGTDVSPYVIAALSLGQSEAEILDDHPVLTPAQIAAARDYASIYPRAGRPLPRRSFKRTLGDLASAGVWDVDTPDGEGETASQPRTMP